MIVCSECGVEVASDRRAARAARWEPLDWDDDHSPMACPGCVGRVIDGLIAEMRRAGWLPGGGSGR